jgi:NADPH:quinone reductase
VKAVLVQRAGGPEALRNVVLPDPQPGPGEVRVSLAAIGVNFADVLCRRATHPSMAPPPIVPGCEAAGVISGLGAGVRRHRIGDRVGVYSPFGGTYAEAVVVPEAYALPLPDDMSFDEAAAFTHVGLTAWHALHPLAHAQPGECLLVTAAAGGLGQAAVQLGRAAGLRVIGAVGDPAKRAAVQALGVDQVLVYPDQDLAQGVARLTRDRGADVVLETVGGAVFVQAQAALAPLGRMVVVGMTSGDHPGPDLGHLLARSAGCLSLNLSVVFAHERALVDRAWTELLALRARGGLTVPIHHRYALARAADAHRLLEARASTGKILLEPTPSGM